MTDARVSRVLLLVCDSWGIGDAPDAAPAQGLLQVEGDVELDTAVLPAGRRHAPQLPLDELVPHPVDGESGRGAQPAMTDPTGRPAGATFLRNNLNKRSVGIDLKHPEGRELFLGLCAGFDVVAENFKAGTMDRLGLGYEHVAAVARLRLALQGQFPEAAWTSERAIRSRWAGSGARVRYADGQLNFEAVCVGLELELSRKHPADYEGIARDVDPAFDQVWWFCRTGDQAWLRGVLEGVPKPPRPEHHVIALAGELAGVLGARS